MNARSGLVAIAMALLSSPAWAQSLSDFEQINNYDISTLIPESAGKAIVGTLATLLNHRSYRPATSLGSTGLLTGLEVTLQKFPESFNEALTTAGVGSGLTSSLPALPALKLHLRKGMGPLVEGGLSGIYAKGIYWLGGDLKVTVYQPSEGVTAAVQMGYNMLFVDPSSYGVGGIPLTIGSISMGTVTPRFKAQTYAPRLILSRDLGVADPYIGAGYEWSTGSIEVPLKVPELSIDRTLSTPTYVTTNPHIFVGLGLNFTPIPIRWSFAMTYSQAGSHGMGTVFSFGF